MKHPKDIDPKDVLGVVKFVGSKQEFLEKAKEIILALHERTQKPKSEAEKLVFEQSKMEVYVFGTVNGEPRNEIWFVRSGGTLTGEKDVKEFSDSLNKKETKLPETDPGLSEWLKTVSEEHYDRAAKLERILRYSTGGTNHKYLIDKYLKENLIIIDKEDEYDWYLFMQRQERKREEKEKKEQEKQEMLSDPNYEKYAEHIKKEHGYTIDDEGFSMMFFLHKHLEETPEEELEKEFKAVEESGVSNGITVDEYFQSLNPQYQYAKGYTEGGKKFMELLETRLKGDERPTIPISEIVSMMKDIFENE